jgi:5-methylcytosine-specific restriction endonuclease McrA
VSGGATAAGWPLAVQGAGKFWVVGGPPTPDDGPAGRRRELLRAQAHRHLARLADGAGTVALGTIQLGGLADALGADDVEVVFAVGDLLALGHLVPRRTVRLPHGVEVVTRAAVVGPAPGRRQPRPARPPLPVVVRARVWARSGGRCWYCGVACNPFGGFCVDHLLPRARGGGEDLANLVPSCPPCNTAKGGRPLEVWRQAIERELEGAPVFTEEQWAYVEERRHGPGPAERHRFWFELASSWALIGNPVK